MFSNASLLIRIAAAGVGLLLLQSCNLFVPKPSDDSKQNTVTNRVSRDGNTFFEGIFIDEISNTASVYRFCPYYAQVPMQYDETGAELPIVDQLVAALRLSLPVVSEGERAAKQGQNEPAVFEFLQPSGLKQLIPFSATDFNGTLSEFERDLKGTTAVGKALRSLSRLASLAANTADAAVSQVELNLTVSSQSKRDALDLRRRLAEGRIEIAITEILTAAAVDKIDEIARLEHKTTRADFQRLNNDQDRNLASATPSQTFEALMKAYQLTIRTPEVTTALCRSPEAMLQRFQELKRSTLSY